METHSQAGTEAPGTTTPPTEAAEQPAATVPLAVDLDGTLLHTDTLHESLLVMGRTRPGLLPRLPLWLAREGRAGLKRRVTEQSVPDLDTLPLNQDLHRWLVEERRNGRSLVLVTAADSGLAKGVADRIGLFDEVLASDGVVNLAGRHKAEALIGRYGDKGFDYAGNSRADVEVWRHARRAVVVSAGRGVAGRAAEVAEVERDFRAPSTGWRTWVRLLRSHQWAKNVLVALPLIAARTLPTTTQLLDLLLAFVAMSLCASAVYIVNDLLDLEADRLHHRKRHRPFASGRVPLALGVALAPLLFVGSLGFALAVNLQFVGWLLVYVAATTAYSLGLKRLALLDCIVLALLYTLRVVAGGAATEIPISFWLVALSVFLFLSLAFLKRFTELRTHEERLPKDGEPLDAGHRLHGRGYALGDTPLVQMFGVAAGFGAALVLALYVDSGTGTVASGTPEMLWAGVPVLLYWVSWLWLKANRGEMHDDPVVFAVKDRASLATGAVFVVIFLAASLVRI